jgi:hypothetical protein
LNEHTKSDKSDTAGMNENADVVVGLGGHCSPNSTDTKYQPASCPSIPLFDPQSLSQQQPYMQQNSISMNYYMSNSRNGNVINHMCQQQPTQNPMPLDGGSTSQQFEVVLAYRDTNTGQFGGFVSVNLPQFGNPYQNMSLSLHPMSMTLQPLSQQQQQQQQQRPPHHTQQEQHTPQNSQPKANNCPVFEAQLLELPQSNNAANIVSSAAAVPSYEYPSSVQAQAQAQAQQPVQQSTFEPPIANNPMLSTRGSHSVPNPNATQVSGPHSNNLHQEYLQSVFSHLQTQNGCPSNITPPPQLLHSLQAGTQDDEGVSTDCDNTFEYGSSAVENSQGSRNIRFLSASQRIPATYDWDGHSSSGNMASVSNDWNIGGSVGGMGCGVDSDVVCPSSSEGGGGGGVYTPIFSTPSAPFMNSNAFMEGSDLGYATFDFDV